MADVYGNDRRNEASVALLERRTIIYPETLVAKGL